MGVHIEIPEQVFNATESDVSREVLEVVALDGFTSGQLSTVQIGRLLGLKTRDEVHGFLAKHNIPWVDYPIEDIERESS